jgi:hypothetical protein
MGSSYGFVMGQELVAYFFERTERADGLTSALAEYRPGRSGDGTPLLSTGSRATSDGAASEGD